MYHQTLLGGFAAEILCSPGVSALVLRCVCFGVGKKNWVSEVIDVTSYEHLPIWGV